MSPTPAHPIAADPRQDHPSGFVLVGVIMFILVLTILGLSLFSLSGFEAQFFNASLYRQDSYYTATGGIERAKWVLMKTGTLDKVRENLPAGVTYSVARQGVDFESGDSTGAVTWNGDPVWIRALAESHGAKTYIEARYLPQEPQRIYKRLIATHSTTTNNVVTDHFNHTPNSPDWIRWPQAWLNGEVWQNSSDLAWQYGGALHGAYTVTKGGVPWPDVPGFLAAYANLPSTKVIAVDASTTDIYLQDGAAGGPPVYYTTANNISNNKADFKIHIKGTAVWMLQNGAKIEGKLWVVESSPDDRLIIVSHGATPTSKGLALNAIKAPVAPLILVTDSILEIVHDFGYVDDTVTAYLSIFAEAVTLTAPEQGTQPPPNDHKMTLTHASGLDSAVLDPLYDAQALPNTLGGATRTMPLVAGTWRPIPTDGIN